ncbi:ribonuclease P/MRP protein subunit RPP1 [Powellomyces hirtus]|nr:ribonuclease P/MRP protein subunit RPP1 [Powellomyces hirtus]
MFLDLNVPYPSHGGDMSELKKTVRLLHQFGYAGAAYTVTVSGKDANKPNPIKPLKLSDLGIPTTQAAERCTSSVSALVSASPPPPAPFQQLTRLTVVVDDIAANYQLNSNNAHLLTYDLIAVQPTSEKLFQAACSVLECDIISLDMSARLPFFLKAPTVNLALQRGLVFEISYSAAIRDPTARKNLVSNAAALVRITRGKGVLLTSDARKAMELRGVYDVINLASIFSLPQDRAKHALDATCRAVLLHAATRKQIHRGVVAMEPAGTLAQHDKWKAGVAAADIAGSS